MKTFNVYRITAEGEEMMGTIEGFDSSSAAAAAAQVYRGFTYISQF